MASRTSIVVCLTEGDHPWLLPAASFVERTWIYGGERSMYEIAAALAVAGHPVELRGGVSRPVYEEITEATSVRIDLPAEPRRPGVADTVILGDGSNDPAYFARVALSPARGILVAFAPPGLFGWPFCEGWTRPSPVHVAIDSLGRPEHFRAIRSLGLELWASSPQLVAEVEAAGVDCAWIGQGMPLPLPEAAEKRCDIVTIGDNRWASLTQRVMELLPGVSHDRIPTVPRDELLERLAAARILVHPPRVEGDSRLTWEARALGTVPIGLESNRFAVGLEPALGGVAVGSLSDIAPEVERLLGKPDELAELARRGMRTAREESDWGRFVERVDQALQRPEPADDGRQARAEVGRLASDHSVSLGRELAALRGTAEQLEQRLRLSEEHAALRESEIANQLEQQLRLSRDEAARAWNAFHEVRHRKSVRVALLAARSLEPVTRRLMSRRPDGNGASPTPPPDGDAAAGAGEQRTRG